LPSDPQGGNELRASYRTGFALLVLATVLAFATPAFAVTSAQKMAEARRVSAQINALDTRVEIADEKYLVAASKHATLLKEKRAAAARVAKAEKRLRKLQLHLDTRANDMYRNGPLGFVTVLFGAKSFDQFARTWDVLKDLNASDADYIGQTKDAKAEAVAAHAVLTTKEAAAAKQQAIMADNKSYVEGQLSERQNKLAGIEAQVKELQAQEAAARLREAAAAQAAAERSSSGGGGGNYPAPSIPAHGNAVDYARSRIGCPYRWAASGPGSFDCSGLMMWCYGKIGISLPHSSSEQINSGPRVSRSDLQPGDLVFFGSPIHHVGMYIGGGEMIEAPYTGASVRTASMDRSDYAGACRPN
jgi:cell wall-associated NlpC family hydrolase